MPKLPELVECPKGCGTWISIDLAKRVEDEECPEECISPGRPFDWKPIIDEWAKNFNKENN